MYTTQAPARSTAGSALLPAARFAGLAWLITTGALLPTTRGRWVNGTANTNEEGN
jgi:hypothetical protein